MTKLEAIAFFMDMDECTYGGSEPIQMAIEALKQEPCEDAISRSQALKELEESAKHHANDSREEVLLRRDRDIIRALPPVKPTRKKGKWMHAGDNCFACSECGEVYAVDQFNHINNYCDNRYPKACPNCGAEMESKCL